jgi:hypothetical protein
MKSRAVFLSAALAWGAIPAWSASAVVLQDGQVFSGIDVRRQGEEVLLTLEGGNVISLPASIVKEIRLSGDGSQAKKEAPSAFRDEGPEVLAGEEVRAPRTSEQVANAGSTSRFQEDLVDSDWQPTTDWDMDPSNNDFAPSTWSKGPVDPDWRPESAFDARQDVLAEGRSGWQKSIVDPSWKPEDGFRRSGVSYAAPPRGTGLFWSGWATASGETVAAATPVSSSGAAAVPSGAVAVPPPPPTPRDDPSLCASRLPLPPGVSGEAAAPRVARLTDARYAALPFPVWEASSGSGARARRIVFTVAGDTCRVLGGDLEAAASTPLSRALQVDRGVLELDAALSQSPAPRLAGPEDRIALAFAAVGVTDPDVSGAHRAEIRLLASEADLRTLAKGTSACTESARKRKKSLDRAVGRFAKPSVDQGPGGTVVRFFSWSSAGGEVSAYEVFVGGDGRVAVRREVVASHVGGHADTVAAVETARRGESR